MLGLKRGGVALAPHEEAWEAEAEQLDLGDGLGAVRLALFAERAALHAAHAAGEVDRRPFAQSPSAWGTPPASAAGCSQ